MLRLTMRRGPTPGASYDLDASEITIGRGSKNTIIIRDDEVSREHCRLVRSGDDYDLSDLGSSNGTFVNGQRAVSGSWPLRPGTLIELGDSITLEYERLNLPSFQPRRIEIEAAEPAPENGVGRYFISVVSGPGSGAIYPLEDIIITVGRETTNDITVLDPEVSRYHLRLRREKRGYSVEDMGSTNGTLLNGAALTQPVLLSNKDTLRLGTMVQLEYVRQAVQSDTAPLDDDTGKVVTVQPRAQAMARLDTLAAPKNAPGTRVLGTGLEQGMLLDHILLAYDRYDWQKVGAPLMLALQDRGLKVWVDQYLAYDSPPWRAAIDQAKRECMLMILVVSPHSMINPVLKQLYREFRGMGKPVVPLLFESAIPATGPLNIVKPIVYQPAEPVAAAHALADAIAHYR